VDKTRKAEVYRNRTALKYRIKAQEYASFRRKITVAGKKIFEECFHRGNSF
jgi:hypothetical protein